MKKTYTLLTLLCGILFLTSCNKGETYSDLKDAEREAINKYISTHNIKVISEDKFTEQGQTTNLDNNEFVYLNKSGVYMQIVREGCGSIVENKESVELLCRFSEYDIKQGSIMVRNDVPYYLVLSNQRFDYSSAPDKMLVERTGTPSRVPLSVVPCPAIMVRQPYLPDGSYHYCTSMWVVLRRMVTRWQRYASSYHTHRVQWMPPPVCIPAITRLLTKEIFKTKKT